MTKAEVSKATLELAEVAALVARFDGPAAVVEHSTLFGGYSGTSIRVVGADGGRVVLKVCHGYVAADVEAQASLAVHARASGFGGMCTALPVRAEFWVLADGVPVLLEDAAGETDLLPCPWPTTPRLGVFGDEGGIACIECGFWRGGARAAADCRGA